MFGKGQIRNFGRNVRFSPRTIYRPSTEADLLEILERHKEGKIRVGGSRHAWSDAIHTDDAFVEMKHFNQVQVDGDSVIVGAGCQISWLLVKLNAEGLTMPSVGLIDEQTIAGAIATATHGSGKHSLSNYVQAVRIACYDEAGDQPRIVDISEGADLLAARCSLGCMGIVTQVTLSVIPQYYVREKVTPCQGVSEALAFEERSPLQQFFILPHAWRIFAQERSVATRNQRGRSAFLYRIYWFLSLDVGIHLLIKLFVCVLGSRALTHLLYKIVVPATLLPRWIVVDRSDRQLVMEHELLRHFEMELFVRRSQLPAAVDYIRDILSLADNAKHSLSATTTEQLQSTNMTKSASALAGRFTHHYPICVRRIIPDNTLISMTSADGNLDEDWYSISLITYKSPRDDFCAVATFLAHSVAELFNARIHWGKWFPQTAEHVGQLYPRMDEFKSICNRYDPRGVFRNRFVADKLGGWSQP